MKSRSSMRQRGAHVAVLALALTLTLIGASSPVPASAGHPPGGSDLYVPRPDHGARRQIARLTAAGDREAADRIRAMIDTPQAVWFTAGSPESVRRDVRATVARAAAKRTVPVLVAYNVPFRDCAQFSAGGATTRAEYEAWIEGFAAGIGDRRAIVILEPDGLGIIPWYDPHGSADGSSALEWCQPAEADPATAAADRFAMLNHAVDVLAALPDVSTYLDGTHSAWLGVGDAAHRLVQAGVADAEGVFLNVSNYQFTANSVAYGQWISACLAYATEVVPGDFISCPNQYGNGQTALSPYGEWSDATRDPTLNTADIDRRYDTLLGGVRPTARIVIDTSRNANGPWQPPAYPDPQDWCNPPGRGTGQTPILDPGEPLVDAYLWVKIPGESDGECTRGLGPAGETIDPEWGRIDPAAGDWFPEMALDLAANADPPLRG